MAAGKADVVEIRVVGLPGPQGSKKLVGRDGKGRGILVESSKKVKPWREAVVWAAREAMEEGALSLERHCNGAVIGAVSVEMIFTLPKPKSAPKRRATLPDRKPDLSKLVRSTEDALTTAGVYEDDARIVECRSAKRYPGEGPDALDVPGCVIRIARAL
jgi:Holliday junction resolvase RusA-like endonuclease